MKQCSDPEAGDPIQYDELVIEHDQGEVEIVVHNRAILLFTSDSEAVGRIHQVCCRLAQTWAVSRNLPQRGSEPPRGAATFQLRECGG